MKTTLLTACLKDLFTAMPGIRSVGTNAAQRVSGTHWVHSLKPLLLLVVFGLVAFSTLAQTIRYVKPSATGLGDGSSWVNASGDLQAMINASTSNNQVWVAAGIFKPTTTTDRTISFAMKNGVAIYGNFAGTEALLTERTLTSPLTTTLSGDIGAAGNADNSYHVFSNPAGLTNSAILDGFVITGGNANGGNAGGGMFNNGRGSGRVCSPLIRNCTFQGNTATYGGAMYNDGDTGTSNPSLTNCSFQGNTASNFGGAMYNNAAISGRSRPLLTNCSFQENTASAGGAMYNDNSNPTLLNCVLFGNGGANTFYNKAAGVSTNYSLFDASVTGYNNEPSNLTVTTSPFASTTSTQLYAYSPAMDAVDPATTTATVGATDLAGNARVFGRRIDMGAYEFNGPFPAKFYVRAGATGANTGQNWTDAFTDLQSALATTSVGSSLTAIWVAAGLYKPTATTDRSISFAMKNGVTILGGFAGTGASPDARTPLSTTLSGDIGDPNSTTDNSYHVFNNQTGLTNTAILDGFVITGGNANSGSTLPHIAGGAMYNDGSSPSLRNCQFLLNSASTSGGGLFNSNSSPVMTNCSETSNSSSYSGGAIQNQEGSSPRFTNCSFQGNSAPNGGAIISFGSNLSLVNSVFWNNGGGATFYNDNSSTVAASYSLFDASVTGYTSGPGNLTTTPSPFASTTNTQLAACSPAINAGSNAAINATGLTTDIIGNTRFYGGIVDMGAYEFNSPLPVPTNLGVGTPAATSVIVTWTMTPATVPAEIRWRAVGTTAWSSATVATGVSSYSITGLTVETTYEWQVRPNCPATPNYISGNNFSTSPYCRPTYSNGCNVGDALTSFSLDNVPLSQGSGCSAGSFTYVATNRQVASGQPITCSGTFSSNSSEGVAIWADLNRNNVFESNEILYQRGATSGPFSGTLTIPASTATGALRIRVLVAFYQPRHHPGQSLR